MDNMKDVQGKVEVQDLNEIQQIREEKAPEVEVEQAELVNVR